MRHTMKVSDLLLVDNKLLSMERRSIHHTSKLYLFGQGCRQGVEFIQRKIEGKANLEIKMTGSCDANESRRKSKIN